MSLTMVETIPPESRCPLCRDCIIPPIDGCEKCQCLKNRTDLLSSAQWTPMMDVTVDKCHNCMAKGKANAPDVDGEVTGYFICEDCMVNDLKVETHNHCNKCGKEIPIYKDSNTNSGYESQTFHLHDAGISGVAGTRQVKMRLCRECYREDFRRQYPPKVTGA